MNRRDHPSNALNHSKKRRLVFYSLVTTLLLSGIYLWLRAKPGVFTPNFLWNESTAGSTENSEIISTRADIMIRSEAEGFVLPIISKDSRFFSVLSRSSNGSGVSLYVWRIASGQMVNERELTYSSIGVTYEQNTHIFTEESDAELKMINPSRIRSPRTIDDFKVPDPEDSSFRSRLRLSPDQSSLLGYTPYIPRNSGTFEFNFWDLETHELIVNLEIPNTILDEEIKFFPFPRFPISTGLYRRGLQYFSVDGHWGLAPKPNGIEIWNLRTAAKLMEIEANAATFSPKSNILISENHQLVQLPEGKHHTELSDIQLWDLNTKEPIVNLGSGSLSFTADGDSFVFYDRQSNKISFFDTLSGKELHSFESDFLPDDRLFLRLAISSDRKWLAGFIEEFPLSPRDFSDVHNTLVLWDIQTGKVVGSPQAVHNPTVPHHIVGLFEFTPDDRHLLLGKDYGHDGGLVEIWRIP